MSKIKNENYIMIQGFMLNDLKLKGNELLIYAVIYGFTQDGKQRFNGGLQYLADWCNSSKRGITKCLDSLLEKKLILKEKEKQTSQAKYYVSDYGTKFISTIEQSSSNYGTKFISTMEQSSPNNIINNININSSKKVSNTNARESYQEIMNTFGVEKNTQREIFEFIKHCQLNKKTVTNDKLQNLIVRLDMSYGKDEPSKITCIKKAVSGGYLDILTH